MTDDLRIDNIAVNHYEIPLKKILSDSTHGKISHFTLITVHIRTNAGAEGLGYTYTVGRIGGGAVRSHIESDLAPLLIGEDPRRVEHLWQRMWWALHYIGRGGAATFAISAVDIALWDLKSRMAGEPLWRFLGGHDPNVKVYAGGIDLDMPLNELLEQTQGNLDKGFRAIKMKVGRERLSEDIERIVAMRQLVGTGTQLMVDANMRWSPEEAIRAARAFQKFDLYWLEEPIIPDDIDGLVRVARDGALPIATGENLHTIYEFQKTIASGGVAFPEPDLSNVGGVTGWIKVARLAEAYNLPVTTHGVHDLHVHLLAAIPNASYLEVHGFGLEDVLVHRMNFKGGITSPPDRPGHGVEFDWEALEACLQ